jgi:hypothetical protein
MQHRLGIYFAACNPLSPRDKIHTGLYHNAATSGDDHLLVLLQTAKSQHYTLLPFLLGRRPVSELYSAIESVVEVDHENTNDMRIAALHQFLDTIIALCEVLQLQVSVHVHVHVCGEGLSSVYARCLCREQASKP